MMTADEKYALMLHWNRELQRIEKAIFEEDDPETCKALWSQWSLIQFYIESCVDDSEEGVPA